MAAPGGQARLELAGCGNWCGNPPGDWNFPGRVGINGQVMAQFTYKARRRSGELVSGSLEVNDRGAAVAQLQRSGLFPITVLAVEAPAKAKSVRKPTPAAPPGGMPARSGVLPESLRRLMSRQRRPKLQELATYTQQLANLLRAGMPLTMALQSMSSLSSKGIPGPVSQDLRQSVVEGRSLSDAMARRPDIFPPLVINMVRAGEQSGALEEVLRRQSAHFERFAEVQAKFKSALIYPAIVTCVGAGLVFFFMTVMLPQFSSFFESFDMKDRLPASTMVLIRLSNFMKSYWWAFPLVGAGAYVVYQRFRASAAGRRQIDALVMRLPIFGPVVRLNLFGQFARTLSTLLQNGVPVLQALRITEQVVPNVVVQQAVAATREAVTDGKSLAQPLARSGIFPQLMIDLIRIGEETGDVPAALMNVAETYEQDLNLALRTMTNLIEPVLIVVIAIVVGGLLISVMQAMFAITSNIQR